MIAEGGDSLGEERKCENCKYYKQCLEWNCLKDPNECDHYTPVAEKD